MGNKDSYIRNKVQNMFTAYLVKSIEGTVKDYLAKKNKINMHESLLPKIHMEKHPQTFEDLIAAYEREAQEKSGNPETFFDGLEDDRLIRAVRLLTEQERETIYSHVFEEKTFREIGISTGETEAAAKSRYYFALKKIRKQTRGKDTDAI